MAAIQLGLLRITSFALTFYCLILEKLSTRGGRELLYLNCQIIIAAGFIVNVSKSE